MRLWCCPYFKKEVDAVVAGSQELSGFQIETYAFSCQQNFQKNDESLATFFPCEIRANDAAIGGGCLWIRKSTGENLTTGAVLAPHLCFYLVAPQSMVDSLIIEGAYLMTPGWLLHWRQQIIDWGFDLDTARQFFKETTQKLVLFNTGIYSNCDIELSAMGEYLNLPVQSIPVGLDILRLSLENLVMDLRKNIKSLPPPNYFFSDQLMVIDLLNVLLASKSEKEAIGHIEDLFKILFAPGLLNYVSADMKQEQPLIVDGDGFVWAESGRGFVISLDYHGEKFGKLEIDDLTFVQYKERYLALALPLAKVCSMAISNARNQEKHLKSEQALRKMASIVESSEDTIIGKTLDGIIMSWNQGAKQIFGYEESEVIGKHISFLTPQDLPDEMPRILSKIKAGLTTDQIETAWMTKRGHVLNVSLRVSPIFDDNGGIVGASSIARDITAEKKKVEREKRSLEEQLQQSQKLESVGRLAGGVAHDFNNMLAVIMGYSQLGLEITPPESEMHENMDEIFHAAERAKGLTRQLLAFARKQLLEMRSINLNTVIQDFSKMIKRLIGEDITVNMKLDDGVPEINADGAMMEQILLNLAVNARDAMPDGGTLTIETKVKNFNQEYASTKLDIKPGEYLMLSVSDSGVGMDEKTQKMIFEPFFTTKNPGKGTGLGLSTVYGIVKQHGGGIWVYSELDKGTIFKIFFPISKTSKNLGDKPVEKESLPSKGETILVVEDEATLRRFICSALSKSGYLVLSAGSPLEAQTIANHHKGIIHLMLTDVVMPEINGKVLSELLASSRPEMKVLFMSGYTENVIAERGILKKGINFIQKPFTMNELNSKLGFLFTQEV